MFKQTVLSSLIFLSSASASFAKSYMGASIGWGSGIGLSSASGFHLNNNSSANLFMGVGEFYGKSHNFYLGRELSFTFAHGDSRHNLYGLGADIIPGYKVNDFFMVYGRLGLSTNIVSHADHHQKHLANVAMVNLGVGAEVKLTDRVALRLEKSLDRFHGNTTSVGLAFNF